MTSDRRQFDVPKSTDIPQCLARCKADKPPPGASTKLQLNTDKTDEGEIWQGNVIW